MEKSLLITGIGSGLGEALAHYYLEEGWTLFALGRNLPYALEEHRRLHFFPCDLSLPLELETRLAPFLSQLPSPELVILNAGVLGEIEDLEKVSIPEMNRVLDVNLWANKALLDFLYRHDKPPRQVVAVSSGAAVNGNKGWGAYSISKAALNMLVKLYANEREETHFAALAPGLVSTPMLNHIIDHADPVRYPSVRKLIQGEKRPPKEAAELFARTVPLLRDYPSGTFQDVRNM